MTQPNANEKKEKPKSDDAECCNALAYKDEAQTKDKQNKKQDNKVSCRPVTVLSYGRWPYDVQ